MNDFVTTQRDFELEKNRLLNNFKEQVIKSGIDSLSLERIASFMRVYFAALALAVRSNIDKKEDWLRGGYEFLNGIKTDILQILAENGSSVSTENPSLHPTGIETVLDALSAQLKP